MYHRNRAVIAVVACLLGFSSGYLAHAARSLSMRQITLRMLDEATKSGHAAQAALDSPEDQAAFLFAMQTSGDTFRHECDLLKQASTAFQQEPTSDNLNALDQLQLLSHGEISIQGVLNFQSSYWLERFHLDTRMLQALRKLP